MMICQSQDYPFYHKAICCPMSYLCDPYDANPPSCIARNGCLMFQASENLIIIFFCIYCCRNLATHIPFCKLLLPRKHNKKKNWNSVFCKPIHSRITSHSNVEAILLIKASLKTSAL